MKLNNKGYAITVIVFGILIIFIIVLSSLLVTMNNSVKLNKVVKEDVIENIQLGADTTGMSLTERIEQLEYTVSNIKQETINEIYPVGSVYISTTDDSIEDVVARFGGQWEKYSQGRTLVGDGSTTDSSGNALVYNANVEGGSTTTVLSTSNLPSHNHSIPKLSGTASNSGSGYTLAYNTTGTNNASTGNQSANHTHSIPALSGTAANVTLTGHIGLHNAAAFTSVHATSGIFGSGHTNTNAYFSPAGLGSYSGAPSIGNITIDASHTHSVTTNATNTGSNSVNHTHKYTNRYVTGVSGVESHSHSVTTSANNTGNTGSGAAFSVQDPYITVYMYKRIK